MSLIEWTESFSVGVDQLDSDHKQLIDIINRVHRAREANESISWAVGELSDYARDHFKREEKMMKDAGYPDRQEHRKRHKEFLEWLRSVQVSLKMMPDAQFHLGADVSDYLGKWLTEHILVEDMNYKGKVA